MRCFLGGSGTADGRSRTAATVLLSLCLIRTSSKPSASVQTRVVVAPHAAPAILEEARSQRCDFIALATRGRGGLRRLLLGSVADKVLRGGVTPMLVCRPRTAM